jgi:hypothetical protein
MYTRQGWVPCGRPTSAILVILLPTASNHKVRRGTVANAMPLPPHVCYRMHSANPGACACLVMQVQLGVIWPDDTDLPPSHIARKIHLFRCIGRNLQYLNDVLTSSSVTWVGRNHGPDRQKCQRDYTVDLSTGTVVDVARMVNN